MKRLFARWWRRRTLHDRLSLLVTAAVAAAVLTVAGIAFAAVSQIQRQQLQSQLETDARSIAAQPEQWRDGPPGPGGRRDLRHWRDIGPRWQVLGRDATVAGGSTNALPVTEGARRVASGQSPRQQERVYLDGHSYLMLTVPAARGGGAVQVAVDQAPANRTLTVFGLLMAASCILGIGGAAALGRTVARAGLVPVQQLTKAVEDVAVTMDLNRPVPIHGVDEIARLGQSVNTMLAAIGAARQAQRTLVEDASHELRTPLTSIRTNIELLLAVERQPELAHRLPPEERAKLLRDLDAQVGELAALTTELVELAREETTREPAEDVELTDVVDAAVDRVRIRVPAVTFTLAVRPVTVHGRPNELERMLVNVLDNAAKWSPPGGVVHTELSTDGGGRVRLTVTDTGPGIDADDLPHVFDRFYRAAAARGMPGSGLGLAIVAQTAAQHGGTVTAGPNDPHGTVVTIRLPTA
ncbi:HAMP domain-containing histidine kinase [Dactylosporangium sp. NBC_01737]|uniref:HAMP domain-containing sensor histidine kinase n=1 Tax=Dactylosporangium sp. NBC_01737 TaxID=2975959 RepID=UPI002E1225DC|nr:HAMP domain-containing histidine kinase [Dactylosporangium sp. NBC_01737]